MLACVRKFTYLSAAKNSNKEYLTYGKGKHIIWENHSFRRNLLRKQGFLCAFTWQSHQRLSSTLPPYAPNGQGRQEDGGWICIPACLMTNFLLDRFFFSRLLNLNPQWGKGRRVLIWTSLDFFSCRCAYAHDKNLKNIRKDFVC